MENGEETQNLIKGECIASQNGARYFGKGRKKTKCHRCDICKRTFGRKANLQFHHQIVHGKHRIFECKVCHKRLFTLKNLKNHQRVHSGERPFKCDRCERSFVLLANLANHKKFHQGQDPLEKGLKMPNSMACNEINAETSNKESCLLNSGSSSGEEMKEHAVQQQEGGTEQCRTESKRFSKSKAKIRKVFKCNKCLKEFKHSSGLSRHKHIHYKYALKNSELLNTVEFVHSESPNQHNDLTENLELEDYNDVTEEYKELAEELQPDDLDEDRECINDEKILYRCDECQKEFRFSSGLSRHRHKHTSCSMAAHTSTTISSNTDNLRTTTTTVNSDLAATTNTFDGDSREVISYADDLITPATSTLNNLVATARNSYNDQSTTSVGVSSPYRRQSTEEKLNKCRVCNKAFVFASGLSRHRKVHLSKDDAVKCPGCPKVFFHTSYLLNHLNRNEDHDTQGNYKCTLCRREFRFLSLSNYHARGHRKSRQLADLHSNSLCVTNCCYNNGELPTNIKGGTKLVSVVDTERSFVCGDCGKSFTKAKVLKVHKKTCSGKKLFKCKRCSASFNQLCDFLTHQQSHTSV